MPEISRFFGIIIAMFFDDHNPPHFHARYGNDNAVIKIPRPDSFRGVFAAESPWPRYGMGGYS